MGREGIKAQLPLSQQAQNQRHVFHQLADVCIYRAVKVTTVWAYVPCVWAPGVPLDACRASVLLAEQLMVPQSQHGVSDKVSYKFIAYNL